MSTDDPTPPQPPAPPIGPAIEVLASAPSAKPPRSWKTWQLATASAVALFIGVGIGTSGTGSEEDKVADSTSTTARTSTTDEPTTQAPTTTTMAPTTVPRPTEHVIGDKVTYEGGASIQIISYEQGVDGGYFDPEPGNEYAIVDVEVCAGSSEISYNEMALAAIMADNRRYSDSFGGARDPGLGSGDLSAGSGCVRGWATLEVPVGQRPVSILWSYGDFEDTRWAVK